MDAGARFVAEQAGGIVGFIGLKRYGEESVEIDVLGVLPQPASGAAGSGAGNEAFAGRAGIGDRRGEKRNERTHAFFWRGSSKQ